LHVDQDLAEGEARLDQKLVLVGRVARLDFDLKLGRGHLRIAKDGAPMPIGHEVGQHLHLHQLDGLQEARLARYPHPARLFQHGCLVQEFLQRQPALVEVLRDGRALVGRKALLQVALEISFANDPLAKLCQRFAMVRRPTTRRQ